MKEKIKKYQPLMEMSNLSSKKTGLDFIIWISPQSEKEKHSARIKIQINNEFIPITISDNPEVKTNIKIDSKKLNKVFYWIKLNKNVLLKYWNGKGKVTIDEILDELQKV